MGDSGDGSRDGIATLQYQSQTEVRNNIKYAEYPLETPYNCCTRQSAYAEGTNEGNSNSTARAEGKATASEGEGHSKMKNPCPHWEGEGNNKRTLRSEGQWQ